MQESSEWTMQCKRRGFDKQVKIARGWCGGEGCSNFVCEAREACADVEENKISNMINQVEE